MKLARLVLGVVCWVPMTVVAQERSASTEPSAPQRPMFGERQRGPMMGMMSGLRHRPTDTEMEEVAQFMREYSPNRWRAADRLPEDGAARRTVLAFAVARWRGIQELKETEPAMYDLKLKQLMVEDDVYGLLAAKATPADREPLRAQVRGAMEQMMNLELAERELRVERLRKELSDEQERLGVAKAGMDKTVERHTNMLIQEGPPALRLGLNRGNQPPRRRPAHPPATRPADGETP